MYKSRSKQKSEKQEVVLVQRSVAKDKHTCESTPTIEIGVAKPYDEIEGTEIRYGEVSYRGGVFLSISLATIGAACASAYLDVPFSRIVLVGCIGILLAFLARGQPHVSKKKESSPESRTHSSRRR